jgi:hypothetical protein
LDFEGVFENNNAYLELTQRQDAGIMLLERFQQVNPVFSDRLFEPYALEILLSQTVFLGQLDDDNRKKVIELALEKNDLRKHSEDGPYAFQSTIWLLTGKTLLACKYAPFLQEVNQNPQLQSFLEDKMHVYHEEESDVIPSFIMECAKNLFNISTNLSGSWRSERQDTLVFIYDFMVEYRPHIPSSVPLIYSYQIEKDSIALVLSYSSSFKDRKNYYFKYSDKQIEIYDFQYDGYSSYEPLK